MSRLPEVPIGDKVLLTLVEAAALCGVSDETLRPHRDSGDLPTVRFASRLLIPRAGLDQFVARMAGMTSAPPTALKRRTG